MLCFVLGEIVSQPLEPRGWDGGSVGSCVVGYVGVRSLDLYGGFVCYYVIVHVAFLGG